VKKHLGLIWALLGLFLLLGLVVHATSLDWTVYWPLWFTEALSDFIIAILFYYPNIVTASALMLGSMVWLTNQLSCWFYTDGQWSMVSVGTLVLNVILICIACYGATRKTSSEMSTGTKVVGSIGIGIMLAFASAKMYLVAIWFIPQVWSNPAFASAMLWGIGIFWLSACSLIGLIAKEGSSLERACIYLAVLGLTIASIAAFAYGLALCTAPPLPTF
jgi:hypothetical protein